MMLPTLRNNQMNSITAVPATLDKVPTTEA